jgi:uncharacterized protein YaeQ
MSGKYSFGLRSEDRRRPLPSKIIIGQQDTETIYHVGLKLLAFIYFHRDRLQMEPDLGNDNIPFVPDLAQLDYELRPALWIECGECGVNKLNKLAVKVPEAEIWVVKRSLTAAHDLLRAMGRDELRRDRYHLLAFDQNTFEEMCGLMAGRNHLTWFKTTVEPHRPEWAHDSPLADVDHEMHFELNELWFQMPFHLLKF